MKKPCLLISGLLLGIVAGFTLQRIIPDGTSSTDESQSQAEIPQAERPQVAEPSRRPTPTEIGAAPDHEAVSLLTHYLRDATLDEVLELLEMSLTREKSPLRGLRWMIMVRGLALDPETVLAWTKEQPFQSIPTTLFHHWALIDPDAALKKSLTEGHRYTSAVLRALKEGDLTEGLAAALKYAPDAREVADLEKLKWEAEVKKDITGALAEASVIEDPDERDRSLRAIAEAWAQEDPYAALRWLNEQDVLTDLDDLKTVAIKQIAETQPLEAYKQAEAIESAKSRIVLESRIAKQMAKDDPDAALQWLGSLPKGAKRDHLFGSMLGDLKLEPEALLNLVEEMDFNPYETHLDRLQIKMPVERSPSGYYYTQGSNVPSLKPEIEKAVLALAEESPVNALETLNSMGVTEGDAFRDISTQWFEGDPEAAAEWAADLPDGEIANRLRESVLQAMMMDSPSRTVDFLSKNEIAPSRNLSVAIVQKWVREDPEATIQWVERWEGEDRDLVVSQLLDDLSDVDPVKALQHLNMLESEEMRSYILNSATRSWTRKEPEAALSWIVTQPPEAGVDTLLTESTKTWVSQHPANASRWIGEMQPGPHKDQAVVGMLDALTMESNPTKDFEAARVWLETIADTELRSQWLQELENRQ